MTLERSSLKECHSASSLVSESCQKEKITWKKKKRKKSRRKGIRK